MPHGQLTEIDVRAARAGAPIPVGFRACVPLMLFGVFCSSAIGSLGAHQALWSGYYHTTWWSVDHIAEIDDLASVGWLEGSRASVTSDLDRAFDQGMSAVLTVTHLFFQGWPNPTLRTDYQVQWNNFSALLSSRVHKVYAFYIIDEPTLFGGRMEDVQTACQTIKGSFPTARTMIAEAIFNLPPTVPAGLDIIGLDYYQPFSATHITAYEQLKAKLSENQQLMLIPKTFQRPGSEWSEIDLINDFAAYYAYAQREPRIAGLFNFSWTSQTTGSDTWIGMTNLRHTLPRFTAFQRKVFHSAREQSRHAACDLAVTNDVTWYVRYNQLNGQFGEQTDYFWNQGPGCRYLAGDFDGDGLSDLSVEYNGMWYLRYCNNDGTFGNQTQYQWVYLSSAKRLAGDINGDGLCDLAVIEPSKIMYIRYNLGGGQFGDQSTFTWSSLDWSLAVVCADFNFDGLDDLAQVGPNVVKTLFNLGNNTFGNERTYNWNTGSFTSAVAGDFTYDGLADLALSDGNTWRIYRHTGYGRFEAESTYSWPGHGNLAVAGVFRNPAARVTVESASLSAPVLLADGVTQHSITLVVSCRDGVGEIRDIRVLFNLDFRLTDRARGYLAWGQTEADVTLFGSIESQGPAAGGGFFGYDQDGWGFGYISPVGCSTSTTGNRRTVVWTFRVNPAWAAAGPKQNNDVMVWVRNLSRSPWGTGWRVSGLRFAVESGASGTPTPTPSRTPSFTPTRTLTPSPTFTATPTRTATSTPSVTPTRTNTPIDGQFWFW